MQTSFIFLTTLIVTITLLFVTIYINSLYVDYKYNINSLIQAEYNLINKGDIYKCKQLIASKNPYKCETKFYPTYIVVDKKDGWVILKTPDTRFMSQWIYMPIKVLLKKKYFCTKRNNK